MRSNGKFRSPIGRLDTDDPGAGAAGDLASRSPPRHRWGAHPERQPAAAGKPDRRARDGTERRDPDPAGGRNGTAQVLLLRLPLSPAEVHDRQHPAGERPADRRRQLSRRSRQDLLPQRRRARTSPTSIRWDGTTGEGRPARNGRYSFRVSPQTPVPRGTQGELLDDARTSASPSMATPSRSSAAHEFGMGAGPLRRRPLRPHPPGPGRDGGLRDTARRCPRRQGPVRRLPVRGRQLRRDRRQGHPHTTSCTRTWPNRHRCTPAIPSAPASRSAIVGETGDAQGCHLHFEMWSPPGWYEGGSPFDPLPELEKWDRYS